MKHTLLLFALRVSVALSVALGALTLPCCAVDVAIHVNVAKAHQVLEGFGATTLSLIHEGASGDSLGPALRAKVLEAVYGQVKLTMGNLAVGLLESPAGWGERRNDNDDPHRIDWHGFNTFQADRMLQQVVKPAVTMGFNNYSLQGGINWIWSSPWLADLYKRDRARCLEECAEQIEACVVYWQRTNQSLPRFVHLFNEPTSGNGEMKGADAQMIRDVVKYAGARLRGAGFQEIKFVVPNEETLARNLAVARVILEDPTARQYVAAIGYHVYPYGSPYVSVPRILKAAGRGQPDEGSIRERKELRDLCRQYGVPVWMTEVSHSEVDPRSLDHLRGRAIHIHDELVYADAAAYYGMNAFWDKKTHAAHFAGRGGESPMAYLSEQDTIALADNETSTVLITGMGYAIGHYARWLKRGAIRIEADSSDPLVLVTAFLDKVEQRFVLIVINNATEDRSLLVTAPRLGAKGDVTGEQSVGHRRWQPLKAFATESPDRMNTTVPALSVTSLAVRCE